MKGKLLERLRLPNLFRLELSILYFRESLL